MKKHVNACFVLAMFCCFLASGAFATQSLRLSDSPSGVQLMDQDRNGLTVRLDVGELLFSEVQTKAGVFTMISAKGLTRSFNIGEPCLPMVNKLISIPFGSEIRAEVLDYETEEILLSDLGLDHPLIPAQRPMSKSADPELVPFEYAEAAYQKAGYYTLPMAETSISGTMRNVRLGVVSMVPMEYDPVANKIKVYKNMTVKVDYVVADWEKTRVMNEKYYSPFFKPVYDRILNYDQSLYTDKSDLVKYPVKYLIISDRMFEAQLQPFIEWKTQKGFIVETYYTDEIGTSNTAIKNHIQTIYNSAVPPEDPAPSFVLFVGDDQEIQAFSGTTGSHISDLYFCEFSGDKRPEIYYGRFSAHTTALLQPQIDKTLEYEKYLMPDPSYLGEVTLISGVDSYWAPTHGNGQINYGTIHYFNLAHGIDPNVWLYPDSDASGASAAIIQTVNNGVGLINYTAHCGHTGFGNPSFTTSDIEDLTNEHMYLLGIGNCCQSNTFGDDYSTPCFGEVWLQEANKGGVGYIGGSNSTMWDPDYWWGVGYGPIVGSGATYEETGLGAYDGMFHDHNEPVSDHYIVNSAIMFCGNLAVEEGDMGDANYYWEIYHLMGDPSVMTYLGVPTVNNVTLPATVFVTDEIVTVQADPGSYVGISLGGVLYGAGYVDVTGSVDVALIQQFSAPCEADIVVTGQNKQPYISTFSVITPDGPYVVHSSHSIDDSAGNADGELTAGESVILGVEVENVGPDNADDVVATLSTSDMYITITDNTETYGYIAGGGGILNSPSAFAFDVSPLTPDGHVVHFDLTCEGIESRLIWESGFNIDVQASDVNQILITIDDAAGGNGNGILDPGETADVIVTLENTGTAAAGNVYGMLSENDSYLSIPDNSAFYGTIAGGGGTADNSGDVFVVSADSSCPQGYAAQMQLGLSGDLSYTKNLTLMITVGDRVVFYWDDFSYDMGWSGLGGSAEWTIGSPSGGGGDPSEDHTPTPDNGVLGNDLTSSGTYNNSISTTQWVTSVPIDCSDYSGIEMRYVHWLGVENNSWDHAYLQVYDGLSWVTLFENGSSTISESEWNAEFYDMSTYADGNPDFQIRFGLGSTDGSGQYAGWNVDDIELKGYYHGTGGTPNLDFAEPVVVDTLIEDDIVQRTFRVYSTGDGELRVRFIPGVDWITCNTDNNYIPVGDSMDFEITIDATDMAPGDHAGILNFYSNDPSQTTGTVDVDIYIHSPSLVVDQSAVSETLEPGQSSTKPVVISNEGLGIMHWTVGCTMFDMKSGEPQEPLGYRVTDEDKGGIEEPYYAPVTKGSGGPDAYGYQWIDSDEAGGPDFDWIDISAIGTELTLSDDSYSDALSLGFQFPFYENSYNDVYVSSNGLLSFGAGYTTTSNSNLPNSSTPNNLIAMWWDDLDPPEAGNVYYYQDAANSRFIVSFEGIRNYQYPSGTGSLTFQAILYNTGRVVLQYKVMDPGADSDGLEGATIGVEDAAGAIGLPVVYNAAYMHDSLAIIISSSAWLSVGPGSGTLMSGEADTIEVSFNAGELGEGTYTGQVGVSCNDLLNPEEILPVTLLVSTGANEPPQIDEIGPQVVTEGDNLNFTVTASDPNGTYPTLLAEDVPENASFENHGDGTGTFDFTPSMDQAGVYNVRFIASDGQYADTTMAQITVEDFYVPGDADGSGTVDIDDAVYIVLYIFSGGPEPVPYESGDADCTGVVDIDDAVYLIAYIFSGGPAPMDCKSAPPVAVPVTTGGTVKPVKSSVQ